jgi:hypothetical protein
MVMGMTATDIYDSMLAAAEGDLRKANTNVELREADLARVRAAHDDALEQQAKMEATVAWLRERARGQSEEPAVIQAAQPVFASAPDVTPTPGGTLFGKPMPEVTNTGLCLRALEQLGKPATTKEIREKIRELGHELGQDQVRGSLKYLAGRGDSPVENPETGVWLLRRGSQTSQGGATVHPLNSSATRRL